MKALDFKDVEGQYEDIDGDTQTSTIRAAVVDDDLAYVTVLNSEGDRVKRRREVTLRDGTARALVSGDVVVATERDGVYDVLSADQWSATAYGSSGKTSKGGGSNANSGSGNTSGSGSNTSGS